MSIPDVSRRSFLTAVGAVGLGAAGSAVLAGCATSGAGAATSSSASSAASATAAATAATSGGGSAGSSSAAMSAMSSSAASTTAPADASGPIVVQSNYSDTNSKAGMEAFVKGYNGSGAGQADLNTVAGEIFRTQLPSYLTAAKPPEVLTWLAGVVAQKYAAEGVLLDLTDVWATMGNYPDALKKLSLDVSGKPIFVPIYNYWVAVYYRPSLFAKWGVQVPKTWPEFKTLCATVQAKGVTPIGIGLSDAPWLASAWFDYFNIRINGAQFHRDVLSGKQSFADPKVKAAMTAWKDIVPYFDPAAAGLAFQEATAKNYQGKTAMFLGGSWLASGTPANMADDYDFFQFPIIDSAVPVAEEGPTDGFFASARSARPAGAKSFLKYAATAQAQETYISVSKSNVLPANPDAKAADTPANKKGKALLAGAKDLTQFFNRDGGDDLQPTANDALVRFLSHPNEIDSILTKWQAAAEKVRKA